MKADGKWHFDTAAGKEEILNRRVGMNELAAIRVCRAYVDAQREYASQPRNGDDVLEYAQRLRSTTNTIMFTTTAPSVRSIGRMPRCWRMPSR